MAGTGNDYIGKVNTTRTNRTCRPWYTPKSSSDKNFSFDNETLNASEPVYWHKVPRELLNNSLYADMSVEDAQNFCRNPSRNLAGNTVTCWHYS